MEKIISNGNVYYYHNGKIYDEHFIEAPTGEAYDVLVDYYKTIDYKSLNEGELVEFIKNLKNSGFYTNCINACLDGLQIFSADFDRTAYPIISSCYRLSGSPQKAIDFYKEHRNDPNCHNNPAMITSLAAAYCDIGDLESAEKHKSRAFAITYARDLTPDPELINLASRIRGLKGEK